MKKLLQYKALILGILTVSLLTCMFVFSCTKSASVLSPNTTISQDKDYITANVENAGLCIADLINGNGFQNTAIFLQLINRTQGNSDDLNSMVNAIDLAMSKSSKSDSSFDYKNCTGIYDWNPIKKNFVKGSSNSITINYPADSSALSNNVSATFDSYTEKNYQINGKTVSYPTAAKLNISKNGIKIANIIFSRTFTSDPYPKATSINLAINFAPFTYTIKINQINPTQYSVVADMGCTSLLNATLTFNSADFSNFTVANNLNKIDFNYSKDNFLIKGSWNANAFFKFTNANTASLNSTFSCIINNANAKIGTLKFKDVNGTRKLVLFFKDGSESEISLNYTPFISNIKNTLAPFFGKGILEWF